MKIVSHAINSHVLKGKFFPNNWEDINPEINILQELINAFTLMCSVAFKLQTLSKNYIGSVIIISCSLHDQDCPALKEKQ